MDLNQLANLGEFIGGVAVLVTLVYVAVQVRQGAVAQQRAADIAASDALQNSADRYSVFRRMVGDEALGEVWAKGLRDEELTHGEAVRVRAAMQELAFSTIATSATWQAAGQADRLEALPNAVVNELRGSGQMLRLWAPMAEEMRGYGFGDLADQITARLRAEMEPS